MNKKKFKINNSRVNVYFLFLKRELSELESYFKIMKFHNKENFDNLLGKFLYFQESEIKNDKIIEISNHLESALNLCSNILEQEEINIFIFQTKDKFISSKMDGSSGFCTNKNCISILLNLNVFTENSLKNTLAHELAHAINQYYDMGNMSVGDGIVYEGLAENFREEIIDKTKSKIVSNVKEEEVNILFNKIKNLLGSKKFSDYYEVFFGTGKYPLWMGYSIGYYLIKKYISKNKNYTWKELLRKNPNEILGEIVNYVI